MCTQTLRGTCRGREWMKKVPETKKIGIYDCISTQIKSPQGDALIYRKTHQHTGQGNMLDPGDPQAQTSPRTSRRA